MKPLLRLFSFAPALCLALPLSAQDMPEMPQPGPQHAKLAQTAGTWDAAMEMTGPDGQPMTSKGVSVVTVALGGFWIVDDFTAELMGMKFVGHGMNGYDPIKGKYVSIWTDSMSPFPMIMEGDYDESGKVLTMTGMGIGHDGQPAKHRLVTIHKDANTNLFEMYVADADGEETKTMTITYKRRPAKAAEASGRK
mgnify:CR=1 FL=1